MTETLKEFLAVCLKDQISFHRHVRQCLSQSDSLWQNLLDKLFRERMALDQQVKTFSAFEQYLCFLATMMEIPPFYFESIYQMVARDFRSDDIRKDDMLMCVLKILKILYLFAQNKQLSPNSYFVLASISSSFTMASLGQQAADLSDSMAVGLWYYRDSPEGPIGGSENIYEVLNPQGEGYSVKYVRNSGMLEFIVHQPKGARQTKTLCKAASHTWNQLSVSQSFTKWFKNLKVIVSFNGFQQTFEMKISKPAELKEYTINLAGGFVGMLGSVVIVKKPADHHLLKLVAENCNLNITSAKDLALLENLANPKKSKKAMQADLALLFSPLSALSNPLLTRLASGPQQDHFSDLVNAKRKIEALGETFSWFKSRQTVDLNRLGGYNAFIMLLSIISSPYSSS